MTTKPREFTGASSAGNFGKYALGVAERLPGAYIELSGPGCNDDGAVSKATFRADVINGGGEKRTVAVLSYICQDEGGVCSGRKDSRCACLKSVVEGFTEADPTVKMEMTPDGRTYRIR